MFAPILLEIIATTGFTNKFCGIYLQPNVVVVAAIYKNV
jgi:hypothetical protein